MSKKKLLSVVLAGAMIASLATVSAVTTSAADVETRGTLFFDSTGLGGKAAATRGTYYCYTWGSVGGSLFDWDTKPCKMTNVDGENLYSYDVPTLNSKGEPVTADLVIFHANGGEQTYDTTFNDDCFGDTAYVLDEVYENTVDSTKTTKACGWRNNPTQGPHIAITSTGKVQGYALVAGETAESIVEAFQTSYQAGMDEGKTGYDDPTLVTEEAFNNYVAEINAIIEEQKNKPTNPPVVPTNPSDAPTTPSDAPTTPSDAPTAPSEAPTTPAVKDPHGRIPGLPLPADMNVPAQFSNKDAYAEAGAPADWDGYYNVYYFEAPQEWLTEHKDAKSEGFTVGFYWYCGGISNDSWPGVPATKLSVLDENGKDIYADKNIYYGFAPSFATNIMWNNGIGDEVAENKKFKLQTNEIKVDDPMSNSIADALYAADDSIEGAYVSGCLCYVTNSYEKTNDLTGDVQTVYEVEWKYFNPRTNETTTEPLKDADGNVVTVADAYWEYEKVALNPYFDLDYTHVNEAEVPTEPAPATLPPTEAKTQKATDATKATTNNANTGKGTVNTSGGSMVVVLATILLAATGVTALARKRRENV